MAPPRDHHRVPRTTVCTTPTISYTFAAATIAATTPIAITAAVTIATAVTIAAAVATVAVAALTVAAATLTVAVVAIAPGLSSRARRACQLHG